MICSVVVLLGGLILIGVVFVCIIAIKRENDREIAFYSNVLQSKGVMSMLWVNKRSLYML